MAGFQIDIQTNQNTLMIVLSGYLDEGAMFSEIDVKKYDQLTIDVGKIRTINSMGVKAWITWVSTIPVNKTVVIRNCTNTFVNSASVVKGFLPPHFHVESACVPYFCESCQNNFEITELASAPVLAEYLDCPKCNNTAEIDVLIGDFQWLFSKKQA